MRIGDADLELAVLRHGVGGGAHLAQDAAQRDGLAGQVGGAVGVKVAARGQAGRQLQPGQIEVEGSRVALAEREQAHVGEILERFQRRLEDAVGPGLAGGGHGLAVADQDVHVGSRLAGEHVLHERQHLAAARLHDHFKIGAQHQHGGFPVIVAGRHDERARLVAGEGNLHVLLERLVLGVALRLEVPRLVRLDQRDIQPLDAGDAVHLSEVSLEINLVEPEGAFLDVAELELDRRLLARAEGALGGKVERLLREPGDGGVGLGDS